MLGVLAGIVGTVAICAWIVAVISALSITQLAPARQRMSIWFTLGWWRFDKVRALAGPAADPHIKRYIWAFVVFFAAIVIAMGIGIAGTFMARNVAEVQQATEPERINDRRVIAVHSAQASTFIHKNDATAA